MKLKAGTTILLLIFFSKAIFSQKSVRDSLKAFTLSVVHKAMEKGKIKKLAVWDFTDINKEVSSFGSYISEQFSVYAENIDTLQLMDRQNLKSLLREHKLKSEGFIDKNTIMELGKFREVEAVAVGSVIMADKDFQVVVKIIETSFGRTISADEQFFQIDKRMAAILGIESNENSNSNNSNNPNRGYNRPLDSNEQYNNAATVNKECEKNSTGDYCFYNNANGMVDVRVEVKDDVVGSSYKWITKFLLKPKESKCIYNYPSKNTYRFIIFIETGSKVMFEDWRTLDQGDFLVEKCKSKTYNIK